MHPYKSFPDRQFWNRSVSRTAWADVFLDQPAKFKLAAGDRIASAGSCFARRIAENLTGLGYNYEYFEPAHPLMGPPGRGLRVRRLLLPVREHLHDTAASPAVRRSPGRPPADPAAGPDRPRRLHRPHAPQHR